MGRAIMLAAMHSGAGKTSITLGVLSYLKSKNFSIRAYKTGPDYIDTAYHSKITKKACINLEPYFLEDEEGENLYAQYKKYADSNISIIEAAMGYYNGIYTQEPRASAYTVANAINAKVCLIVDEFDAEKIYEYIHKYDALASNKIEALILNKCRASEYSKLKNKIENLCNTRVLGFLEERTEFKLESRHLGLRMPKDSEKDVEELAKKIAKKLAKNVDMSFFEEESDKEIKKDKSKKKTELRLAISMDKAFCFIYEDNLSLLRENGFEIVEFSPLNDNKLPDNIDALWLCGGYPEIYAKELAANISMKESILKAMNLGLPTIAECGGFMYLHKRLEDINSNYYNMVGFFNFDSFKTDKLQRFGYIEVKAKEDNILLKANESFKSHEFHYWDSEYAGSSCTAIKANKSKDWECIHTSLNIFAGYPHIYLRSNMKMIENFKKLCLAYKKEREDNV